LHRYKLAEKLTDRLDGLNKDLSDVIEEINGVSALLSNSSGTDDPVSFAFFLFCKIANFINSCLMLSACSTLTCLSCKRLTRMRLCCRAKCKKRKNMREPWVVEIGGGRMMVWKSFTRAFREVKGSLHFWAGKGGEREGVDIRLPYDEDLV
jgi:hypothetical protein